MNLVEEKISIMKKYCLQKPDHNLTSIHQKNDNVSLKKKKNQSRKKWRVFVNFIVQPSYDHRFMRYQFGVSFYEHRFLKQG